MKRVPTLFLQFAVILVGIGALIFLLWEPHLEGRNAHAMPFQIYFNDPFLAYAYVASTSFFVALYQTFRVLGYAGQDKIFSPKAVKALRTIKYCAVSLIGFVALGEVFLALGPSDDRAGGVFMGVLLTFGVSVMAAAAAMGEQVLQSAIDRLNAVRRPGRR